MMLPPVVPCEMGPVIPVGMLPATTVHCTGVGVAPLSNVVSHPVVSKLTAVDRPAVTVTGARGTMVQPPVGGAGVGRHRCHRRGAAGNVTVAVGVSESEIVTLQSGAVKLLASIR